MPLYTYIDDDTKEVFEVVQRMTEKHELIINGKAMRRVFEVPNATIDGKINPFDERAFVEKTARMKGGTIGGIQDYSQELSEKRGGEQDPLREKYYKNYEKKRKGMKHPDVRARERAVRLKNLEAKTGLKITE